MDSIEIVRIGSADVKALQQISRQTFSEAFASDNSEENMRKYLEENLSEERLLSELRDGDSEFYFAKTGDHVIGYLKLNHGMAQTELKDEKALEIERIYVIRQYYGRAMGQLLLEKAMERARASGADYVWLAVWEKNPRAIQFYRKNGFAEFGEHIFRLGEEEQRDVMMRVKV